MQGWSNNAVLLLLHLFAAPVAGLLSQHVTAWGVSAKERVVAEVISCQWLGLGLQFSPRDTSIAAILVWHTSIAAILVNMWNAGMWGAHGHLLPSAGVGCRLGCCFAVGVLRPSPCAAKPPV